VADEADDRITPVPFRVAVSRTPEVARVTAVGDVDLATVDEFTAGLNSALSAPGVRRVVIDLAEVGFLASSGISALIGAHRRGQRQSTTVVLVNCRPTVAKVLEITGVDKVLTPDGDHAPEL